MNERFVHSASEGPSTVVKKSRLSPANSMETRATVSVVFLAIDHHVVRLDDAFGHVRRTRRSSSKISSAAPTVIALSATLKDGK